MRQLIPIVLASIWCLSTSGCTLFDVSLPPGGSTWMSLEYEEVLAPCSGGLYRYRYVLRLSVTRPGPSMRCC